MKAIVLDKPKSVHYKEVPSLPAKPGELVLKVEAVTLCGSDVRVYLGQKTGGVVWPKTIGHEFAGVVTAVGEGVEGYLLGDRVSVMPWISCLDCASCQQGVFRACPNKIVMGYGVDGGLAEEVLIPEKAVRNGNVIHLPEGMDFALGAMAEPLACVVRGHLRSEIRLGQSVLIIGGGPIGLFHAELARRAGASRVIVSEPSKKRRQFAEKVGATHTIDPTQSEVEDTVRRITDGAGVDAAILCIGYPDLVNSALNVIKRGGRLNLFAGFGGSGQAELAVDKIHYEEIDVIGTTGPTREEYLLAVNLLHEGLTSAAGMITHEYPLKATEEALQMAISGEALKVAVLPNG